MVTGIGWVHGVECMVVANDPTVKGGSQGPTSGRKGLRAMEIARVNRLPLINFTESGGADLPKQADIFVPGGASFKNLTQLSAAGIPTITLVFGSSTAGGAYVPGNERLRRHAEGRGEGIPRWSAASQDGHR